MIFKSRYIYYCLVLPLIISIFVILYIKNNKNLIIKEYFDPGSFNNCPVGCTSSQSLTGNASDIFPYKKGTKGPDGKGCFRYIYDTCASKYKDMCVQRENGEKYCYKHNICQYDSDCLKCQNHMQREVDCDAAASSKNSGSASLPSVNPKIPGWDSHGCPTNYGIHYCPSGNQISGVPDQNIPPSLPSRYNQRCFALGQTCSPAGSNQDPKPDHKPDPNGQCVEEGAINCGSRGIFPPCQQVKSLADCKAAVQKCFTGYIYNKKHKMCVKDKSGSGSGSGSGSDFGPGSGSDFGPDSGSGSGPGSGLGSKSGHSIKAYNDDDTLMAYDSVWNLY